MLFKHDPTFITNFGGYERSFYELLIAESGIPLTIESPAYDVEGKTLRDSLALHDHRTEKIDLEAFWKLYAKRRPEFLAKLVRVNFTDIEWDTEGETLGDCGLSTTATIRVNTEQYDTTKPEDMEAALSEHFGFQLHRCNYKVSSVPCR